MIPSPAGQEGASLKKIAFVYLLRNVTGGIYVGWTTDLNRRLDEHNSGKSSYTKPRGPWQLAAYEEFSNIDAAKKRERALKNNPRMLKFFKKRALATLRPITCISATFKPNTGDGIESSAALQQSLQVMG